MWEVVWLYRMPPTRKEIDCINKVETLKHVLPHPKTSNTQAFQSKPETSCVRHFKMYYFLKQLQEVLNNGFLYCIGGQRPQFNTSNTYCQYWDGYVWRSCDKKAGSQHHNFTKRYGWVWGLTGVMGSYASCNELLKCVPVVQPRNRTFHSRGRSSLLRREATSPVLLECLASWWAWYAREETK